MKKVAYIGEKTGDNLQLTPDQLLAIIRDDLMHSDAHPVKGLFAVLVREAGDGTLHLDNFRCGLPKFVEVAVIQRTALRTLGVVFGEDA